MRLLCHGHSIFAKFVRGGVSLFYFEIDQSSVEEETLTEVA